MQNKLQTGKCFLFIIPGLQGIKMAFPECEIKSFILCERMAFPEICSYDLYPGLRDKDGQRLWRSPLDHLQLGGICRV
jgi:hypothetical protein